MAAAVEEVDQAVEELDLELDSTEIQALEGLEEPEPASPEPPLAPPVLSPGGEPQPTVAVPGRGHQAPSATLMDTYAEDARRAVDSYQAELRVEDDPVRKGRLHFEIGRLQELVLGQHDEAIVSYRGALHHLPDFLPAIVGARRIEQSKGQAEAALELFDREIRLTADRRAKATLMFARARLLEDELGRPEDARAGYAAASEMVESDPRLLKGLEQLDQLQGSWDRVIDDHGRIANAVVSDPHHRAAIVARRARLIEVHQGDPDSAVELYAASLEVDRNAPGAIEALKRLHYERHRWRELIGVLEREAEMASDPVVRTMALYRIGQIQAERLGNRNEAIQALERAAKELPVQPVVLEALARLYEQAEALQPLAATLSRLVECTEDPRERLGYLHRIGELCRDGLGDDEAAMRAYEAALESDPTYIPALRALAPMYAKHERWQELVRMHEAEAEATNETGRRAVAHARAAEILERLENSEAAIIHHERALSLDPTITASFRALVRLYTEARQWHKLVELYERNLERVDVERRIEYLFSIGDLYRGPLGDPEQAEYAYRRVLKLRPTHLGAVHAIQRTTEGAARYPQLVEALELEADMIDEQDEIVALLHRAGDLLHEQIGDRAGAVARFKRVLDINGYHVATLASLGRIYHTEGNWSALVEIYARELEVTPDGPAAVALLHKMGEIHARYLSDPERAADCYRRALELDPRHGPSLHALGRLLTDRGLYRELVELIEQERDSFRDPQSRAMAAFRAGEIYEDHLDEKPGAERCYAQALELRPSFRPAADALARVRSQLRHWEQLAEELEHQAATTSEPTLAIGALLRAAEVWFDDLDKVDRAVGCYESILERDPEHLGALLGLEPLYRRQEAWERLAELYAKQVLLLSDPGAKAAVLTERARVLGTLGAQGDDLIDTLTAILAMRPGDRDALTGLERLAVESSDPRVMASVDARLASAVSDELLRAAYLTRQAECLETAGQPQALQIYREALRLDGMNRAALRGMARLAEVLGDGEAMAEAAERAAGVAKRPQDAADAWVLAGEVRVEKLDDREGGIAAFEQGLALWPDHEDAATQLSRYLRANRDYDSLVERLSRAAKDAKRSERQSALWIEVARLYADALGNVGAALSALKRLVGAQPKNAHALLELGKLLASDRRYDEAIVLLDRCVGLKPADQEILRESHFLLARSHEENADSAAAFEHYEKALEFAPTDRRVLERVVELQIAAGRHADAVETATSLLELARGDAEKVAALVELARALAGSGREPEAMARLAEAVALEGPHGRAGEEVARVGQAEEHWSAYIDALHERLRQEVSDERRAGALFLEIARTLNERLHDMDRALSVLVEGLRSCKNDGNLRFELGKRLRQAGRAPEAVEQFQYLLMDEVVRVEAWRYLAQTFEQLGRSRERLMCLSALAVLEEASTGELDEARAWQSRTTAVPPGSFLPGAVSELFVARDQQTLTTTLIAAMADGLGKVRSPDLSAYGVSSRDKIAAKSEHPLRALVDHLAGVLGVEEYDLYVHHHADRPPTVENTPRPSVMLPMWIVEMARSQQVFLISQLLVNLARGIYPIDVFTPREMQLLVAGAVRTVAPDYGTHVASSDVLDDHQRLIMKGIPRRKRKIFEAAGEAYAKGRPIEVATYVQWAKQSARRVALILADDLLGSMKILARTEKLEGRGIGLVRSSPIVGDLLKVWVSKPAMALRQRSGLLPGAALGPAPSPSGPSTPST